MLQRQSISEVNKDEAQMPTDVPLLMSHTGLHGECNPKCSFPYTITNNMTKSLVKFIPLQQ